MTTYYTGIGSRETPSDVQELMTKLAAIYAERGYVLRSGAAEGADSAFEAGAGDLKEIFIPWKGFSGRQDYVEPPIEIYERCLEIARSVHPKFQWLSYGAKKLHARNVNQILGPMLDSPSKFVVCWTKKGQDIGGTRTAIVIARQNNIPVYNFGDPSRSIQEWFDYLQHLD